MDSSDYIILPDGRTARRADVGHAFRVFSEACSSFLHAAAEAIRPLYDVFAALVNDPKVKALLAEAQRQQLPPLPSHGASRVMRERRRRRMHGRA